ncbi:hypothetical protein QCE63_23210 [Caballeronia sp. LZ065]|uniref:hypothetical protein n=1 Tax=Caballeronia sp. LZ065 TaxID=3038571 RepID=UPI00285F8ED5|nr:hypothetical protein [Caballeronia sp. LZ065]MDR5782316.1 hypothetical protein [Caballeronia sp. LZ065]
MMRFLFLKPGLPASFASALLASACVSAQVAPDAARIAGEIETQGAQPAVTSLDRDGQFDAVLDSIASGNAAWVELAPRLAQGTDASASIGLTIALATALPKNPAAVLSVLDDGPVLGAAAVCGAPFIEPAPGEMKAYLDRAIPAVSDVPEGDAVRRAPCLDRLAHIQRLLETSPTQLQ